MTDEQYKAVGEYQCPGCVLGSDPTCGHFTEDTVGIGCSSHSPGTNMFPGGLIFLGMPKGFDKLGNDKSLRIKIFETWEQKELVWAYNQFNVPVWKHRTPEGWTIVKGLMPRISTVFLHLILEDCMEVVDCTEVDEEFMSEMD